MRSLRTIFIAALFAAGLTWIFWQPLWYGGGFIGGDIYTYYFPQKTLYAEGLRTGDIPFWNPRTGFGYPFVAESQAGVFYPFHLVAYFATDVNTAYSAIQLLHYVLAFVFTMLYARSFKLSWLPSLLAALVYTYGWFPARSCVEWAVICGAWLPAALWCAERFLQTRLWRYAVGLSAVLGVQMLAGHFEIAFITQLALAAYIPLRIWWARDAAPADEPHQKRNDVLLLATALLFGFALAAVQLLPTAELKRVSGRASADQHEIEFGSIPVWYLSQTVMPWKWYSPLSDRDRLLAETPPVLGGRTNQVEAHMYFGLLPLALALWGIVLAARVRNRRMLLWAGLGLAAIVYSTGVLLPITRHLPGFAFFQGPGRYGILATFAVGILAASALEQLMSRPMLALRDAGLLCLCLLGALASCWLLTFDADQVSEQLHIPSLLSVGTLRLSESQFTVAASIVATLGIFALAIWSGLVGKRGRIAAVGAGCFASLILLVTLCDLWIVSRLVSYTTIVNDPPVKHLAESPLRQLLAKEAGPIRLYAPGANLPNVFGVSSTPVYFTFAPAAYTDPDLAMPKIVENPSDRSQRTSPEQLDWLRRAGVTHVLSLKPLDESTWPAELIWRGFDPVLNGAWTRPEELWLYRLRFDAATAAGRARFADHSAEQQVNVTEHRPHRVVIETTSQTPGRLILTDLMYPGWGVSVDDQDADPVVAEKIFRAVDLSRGSHTIVWSYEPRSLYYGAGISLAALLVLAAVAHVRFWHSGQRGSFSHDSHSTKE